jgi:hypothetical protein
VARDIRVPIAHGVLKWATAADAARDLAASRRSGYKKDVSRSRDWPVTPAK